MRRSAPEISINNDRRIDLILERLGKIGKIRNKTCGGISHTPAGKRGFHNSVSGRKNPFRHWFSHGLSNISYVHWLTGYEVSG